MPHVAAVSTAFLSNSEVTGSESSVPCAVLSASISRRGNPVFSAQESGHYSGLRSYQDRLKPKSLFKEDSFALNTCASAEEKIAQLGRVEIAIVLWIEAEKDFAARGEVML